MRLGYLRLLSAGLMVGVSTMALAQTQPGANRGEKIADSSIGDIIVTAQKRAQSINSVGLTISAASSDTLTQRGVSSTADLAKITPGFTFTQSPYTTPVFTLRGIGLYDYSFGASPSVAVYVDEVSLPFPIMSLGAALDVERVEVLKGPQGTLFGQSSTGGAINYIAAKPTSTLRAGADISYERFGKIDASGFISGPLSDTLRARLAVRAVQGGDWQYSVSRPHDKNGASDQLLGRLLVDWDASEALRFSLNVNGWRDKSDTQQPQFTRNQLNIVAAADPRNPNATIDQAAFASLTTPGSPNYDSSFLGRQNAVFDRAAAGELGAKAYLAGPNGNGTSVADNSRQAEWNSDWPIGSDDSFYQVALRAELDLTDDVKLTSLTSYAKTKINRYFDNDATTAAAIDARLHGFVKSFSQELRLSGSAGKLNWIVGGNYDHASISDTISYRTDQLSSNEPIPGLRYKAVNAIIRQKINNYAGFANADFKVTDKLSILGGIRYTQSNRRAGNCGNDISADQTLSTIFSIFGGLTPIAPGQCYVLDDTVAPTDPGFLKPTLVPFEQSLKEHNVSFRVGVNYKFDQGTLLYATVSQGYKAGILSGITPAVTSQYRPARQEKVIAYEAGFKMPLFNRHVQLNGAGFLYDYSNKQVRARVNDPIFGLLEELINVPKSRIWGLEAELLTQPAPGLNLSASATYLHSKVTDSFTAFNGKPVYNQAGYAGDLKGSPLPYTAKFSGVFDGQYEFPVSGSVNGFLGGTVTYTSRDNTTFYNDVVRADEYFRRKHALVDLRLGFASPGGTWRVSAFGRNIFDKYYETTIFAGTDTLYRYSGRPATYGLSLSLRTN